MLNIVAAELDTTASAGSIVFTDTGNLTRLPRSPRTRSGLTNKPVNTLSANPIPIPTAIVTIAVGDTDSGGLEALTELLRSLPADFTACLLVVMRQGAEWDVSRNLAEVLDAHTSLPVYQARSGDRLTVGTIFVAPSDYHLLMTPIGVLWLTVDPKVHEARPAADPLFQSVAEVHREKVIGVVLTGEDGDGAAGIEAIKRAGGSTIVQDESTSQNPSMPHCAIATGRADLVLPLGQIAAALIRMVASQQ
jgi:two-component system chemotaxis response regulator CheB